jgi:hypothetical protein
MEKPSEVESMMVAGLVSLPFSGLTLGYGKKDLGLLTARQPPLCVALPVSGTGDAGRGPSAGPRPIDGYSVDHDVYCWGSDSDAAWRILSWFTTVLHNATGFCKSGQIYFQSADDSYSVNGFLIVPRFSIDLAVSRYVPTYTEALVETSHGVVTTTIGAH